MEIETPRLILREYAPQDFDRVHIYGRDPEFSRYEEWGPNTEADTRKFVRDMVLQASDQSRWKFDLAICLKEDGLLIGGCGIRRESPNSSVANLGWAVNPSYQRKGFASEAAQALIRFGFEELRLHLIYATCDSRNTPSERVMMKIGLTPAGVIPGHKMQKGILRDTLRFEISRNHYSVSS